MPILGVIDSSKSGNLIQQGFNSIATATPTSGVTVTFSNIPQVYTHLQLRMFIYQSAGNSGQIFLNGDTTNANYYTHSMYQSVLATGTSSWAAGYFMAASGNVGNPYGQVVIADILDYTSSKNKMVQIFDGGDDGTTNQRKNVEIDSITWTGTSAITTIRIDSGTFVSGTHFALYGIKN